MAGTRDLYIHEGKSWVLPDGARAEASPAPHCQGGDHER
ncbi:Hypothetical protein CAP_3301 [Chondromyces apiculatus DSM 436]|uniref:Uncharacterized protein n=1 Tax=Chondromyces apiculatus DSM 436 TaxID=1192034 RepID=A0A017T814_9BACT|nr:Hypothetical protein CAP_3301 [Chondromyces apiculatus DSM 436]